MELRLRISEPGLSFSSLGTYCSSLAHFTDLILLRVFALGYLGGQLLCEHARLQLFAYSVNRRARAAELGLTSSHFHQDMGSAELNGVRPVLESNQMTNSGLGSKNAGLCAMTLLAKARTEKKKLSPRGQ